MALTEPLTAVHRLTGLHDGRSVTRDATGTVVATLILVYNLDARCVFLGEVSTAGPAVATAEQRIRAVTLAILAAMDFCDAQGLEHVGIELHPRMVKFAEIVLSRGDPIGTSGRRRFHGRFADVKQRLLTTIERGTGGLREATQADRDEIVGNL